jgi:hypothetical protein
MPNTLGHHRLASSLHWPLRLLPFSSLIANLALSPEPLSDCGQRMGSVGRGRSISCVGRQLSSPGDGRVPCVNLRSRERAPRRSATAYPGQLASLSAASSFGTMVLGLRSSCSRNLLANLGKLRPIRESRGSS